MKFKFSFLFLFFATVAIAQTGKVTGKISDNDLKGESLPFANVAIKGTSLAVTTDMEGKYSIEVPEGNHTIVFSFLGYESKEVAFSIAANETKELNENLGSGSVTMEDVVIKATTSREKETALLLDQRKAVEIKQSIGAQEMSRKGVSNVESGLTKITGISKVESRGLFVRGLEERYNNLLINDLQAPSNSPFKKIIPLDLFPTDIVGVLSVFKTFNPNISGDFAGATINIETAQPRTSITKLSTGFGFTTGNNNEDFLISEDANTTQGFLGFLGKDRALPSQFGTRPSGKILTAAEYKETSKQNSWNVDSTTSPINNSLSFLHAEKFSLENDKSINYIFSFNGDNKYKVLQGVNRTFNQGQGNYDNNLIETEYDYSTTFSGLFGVKYKSSRFAIAVNSFMLRSTSSAIIDNLGYTNSLSTDNNIIIRENTFEESNYWNNQILANYDITKNGNHSIKGGFSYVKTAFGQPDRKFIRGRKLNDTDIQHSYGGNTLIRQFLDVSGDRYFSGMLEYSIKFKEKENGKATKLAFGYNGFSNEQVTSYRFLFGKPLIASTYVTNLNDINQVINTDVNSGILNFTEESPGSFKNKLFQNVNAGYVNSFFNFGEKWELNGGVRVENSVREIKYREVGDAFTSNFRKKTNEKLDILPSVNVKYILNEKNNIRFAGSKTLTSPITSEVIPIEYVNPDGTVERGNPNLLNSDNINIDLKYELFPNNNELIAVGVFGKQITNPIERVLIPTGSSGGQIVSYDNSKEATVYGIEIEALLQLKRISPFLNKFSWGFNTSLMKTKVKTGSTLNTLENNSTRALQGAADWVINSDLKYDFEFNEDMKNTISVVYGVTGDRIYTVGTAGIDHIYERPFHKMDFVWSSKLSKNIEAKLAVNNILDPTFKRELGSKSTQTISESDLTLREYKRGTGFSLNISYTF
ncbi:carboxypeptidase-like regulatory domain-containing protein [Flavobacterium sp.]|uniref:TonB-dependent receptor n=1 Tax=Flavobacterium sp. TaxID=239 RepID=UPI00286E3550|nr:carboxypeptidase-like regulatory domain-containing protein [Flavobacterium sp.]